MDPMGCIYIYIIYIYLFRYTIYPVYADSFLCDLPTRHHVHVHISYFLFGIALPLEVPNSML